MIGVASGANHKLSPDDIDRLPDSIFRAGDVLLAGLEIPIETAARAIERGARRGDAGDPESGPGSVDRRRRSHRACSRSSTCSHQTASRRSRWRGMDPTCRLEPDWNVCADRLLQAGPRAVVITLGARGCLVATSAKQADECRRRRSRRSTPSAPATRSMARWRSRLAENRSLDGCRRLGHAPQRRSPSPSPAPSRPYRTATRSTHWRQPITRTAHRGGDRLFVQSTDRWQLSRWDPRMNLVAISRRAC